MTKLFSTVQTRNAKALLRDLCNDISVIPFKNRSDLEHVCDIIIMRVRAAKLPELFTDELIAIINRRTVASLLDSVTLLEDEIKEVER